MSLSPEQRSLRASIGGHARAAKYDGRKITAAARAGRMAKLRRQVEEETPGLPEAEVDRRANHLLRAEMMRLALASSKARAARKATAS
jgi:hypothetical protein